MLLPCTTVEVSSVRMNNVAVFLERDDTNSVSLYVDGHVEDREPDKFLLIRNVKKVFSEDERGIMLVLLKLKTVKLFFATALDKITTLDLIQKLPYQHGEVSEFTDEEKDFIKALKLHEPKVAKDAEEKDKGKSLYIRSGNEFNKEAERRRKKEASEDAYAPMSTLKRDMYSANKENTPTGKDNHSMSKPAPKAVSVLSAASSNLPVDRFTTMISKPRTMTKFSGSKVAGRSGLGIGYSASFASPMTTSLLKQYMTKDDDYRYEGFQNLGNTCYINAVLQALCNLAPFTLDLLNKSLQQSEIPPESIYRSLTFVVNRKRNQDVVSPKILKDAIARAGNKFSGFHQEDAHEFLGLLLDLLASEVAPFCGTPSGLSLNDLASSPMIPTTINDDESGGLVVPCPISTNFRCEVQHTLTCNECKTLSVHNEFYHDLSLNFPDSMSEAAHFIEDLFENFFEDEPIDHRCEECGSTSATLSHRIKQLPRILILHIKRFRYNTEANYFEKRRDYVTFRSTLNLAKVSMPETLTPVATPTPPRPIASAAAEPIDDRPECPYGEKCYRQHEQHWLDFKHPTTNKRPAPPPTPMTPVSPPKAKRRLDFNKDPSLMTEDEQMEWALSMSMVDAEDASPKSVETKRDPEEPADFGQPGSMEEEDDEEAQFQLAMALSKHEHDRQSKASVPTTTAHITPAKTPPPRKPASMVSLCNYQLHAVVSHQGVAASNGHYICDVWDGEAQTWKCYNDSVMTDSGHFKEMMKQRQRSSYLFFFVHQGR